MSFSKFVKQEVSQNVLFECCQRSQLSALILLSANLVINSDGVALRFKTENSYIAKRVWQLIKDLYEVELSLDVFVKQRLKKNNSYQVTIKKNGLTVLEDLDLYSKESGLVDFLDANHFPKECCQRAYLAGAFMAGGSINSPATANYHLEIATNKEEHSKLIQDLLNNFNLNAKITKRRNSFVVYVKEAEKISDFLRAIGSSNAVMEFEEHRIQRDFVNSFTRLDNFELANEVKVIEASQRQLEDIQTIEDANYFDSMTDAQMEAIELRRDFPDSSLKELSEEYDKRYSKKISKSGLKHRFKRIEEIAENIREGNFNTQNR